MAVGNGPATLVVGRMRQQRRSAFLALIGYVGAPRPGAVTFDYSFS
jgi:hypothetical protein